MDRRFGDLSIPLRNRASGPGRSYFSPQRTATRTMSDPSDSAAMMLISVFIVCLAIFLAPVRTVKTQA